MCSVCYAHLILFVLMIWKEVQIMILFQPPVTSSLVGLNILINILSNDPIYVLPLVRGLLQTVWLLPPIYYFSYHTFQCTTEESCMLVFQLIWHIELHKLLCRKWLGQILLATSEPLCSIANLCTHFAWKEEAKCPWLILRHAYLKPDTVPFRMWSIFIALLNIIMQWKLWIHSQVFHSVLPHHHSLSQSLHESHLSPTHKFVTREISSPSVIARDRNWFQKFFCNSYIHSTTTNKHWKLNSICDIWFL